MPRYRNVAAAFPASQCVLDTEYVGVVDFRLEESDLDFLWRKGYLTTMFWLEKRSGKARERRRKAVIALARKLRTAAKVGMFLGEAATPGQNSSRYRRPVEQGTCVSGLPLGPTAPVAELTTQALGTSTTPDAIVRSDLDGPLVAADKVEVFSCKVERVLSNQLLSDAEKVLLVSKLHRQNSEGGHNASSLRSGATWNVRVPSLATDMYQPLRAASTLNRSHVATSSDVDLDAQPSSLTSGAVGLLLGATIPQAFASQRSMGAPSPAAATGLHSTCADSTTGAPFVAGLAGEQGSPANSFDGGGGPKQEDSSAQWSSTRS